MGKLIRNGIEYGGGNGTDIFEVTQAEYDALVQAGTLVHNALYVISDAPNLNPTASDIEYSGAVTVKQAIDGKIQIATFQFTKTVGALSEATFTVSRTDLNLPTGAKVKDAYIKQNSGLTYNLWAYALTTSESGANAIEGAIYNGTGVSRTYTVLATVFYTL